MPSRLDITDLLHKKFGRLSVIGIANEPNDDRKYPLICQCDCGNKIEVVKRSLIKGSTKSCGCLLSESSTKRHAIARENYDWQTMIGQKHGKMTVIQYVGYKDVQKRHCFSCRCDCGNVKEVCAFNLSRTLSCGCSYFKRKYDIGVRSEALLLNQRKRMSFSKSKVRRLALDRDENRCYLCKKKDVWLEVHHIEPWEQYPLLRLTLSNLITLCFDCHLLAHKNFVRGEVDPILSEKFKIYTQSFVRLEFANV